MPRYESSDGFALHYDDIARADAAFPIILLAGGAARHPSYLGDLAGLSDKHRLIVPHLRGVGLTTAPSSAERGSWWGQADDVEQLRVHLCLERVVLVAHSAGTRLAIAYAAQFPHLVAALVLITPPAEYLVEEPPDADTLIEKRRGDSAFDAALLALHAGPQTSDDDAFNAWQQNSAAVGYANWDDAEQLHAKIGRWSFAAATAFFDVVPPHDIAARLGEMTAPVLVISGTEDCLVGLAPVRALAHLFPAGASATVEACGHYPWVEQPAAFRRIIDTFLDRADKST
ncbi:alpha/beta fold hydrolase [Cryobacterium sp. Y50]|uniref:alpha/beta fold hydrolase n=1 Tax=Cryobacterium sp. Y50 TaxID=2048286 RepID=UPI000CE36FCE|nr:alpha/beta hydrolase [Cryobacterium sp. Y50]